MNFIKIAREFFSFLQTDFDCAVSTKEDAFRETVIYQNKTTAITVTFEPREGNVYVLLSRLVNGKMPPYPIFIKTDTILNMFYFDDLIDLRAPSSKIKQIDVVTEQNLKLILRKYGESLKCYGLEVLEGDFSIFSELEQIVKKRASQQF